MAAQHPTGKPVSQLVIGGFMGAGEDRSEIVGMLTVGDPELVSRAGLAEEVGQSVERIDTVYLVDEWPLFGDRVGAAAGAVLGW